MIVLLQKGHFNHAKDNGLDLILQLHASTHNDLTLGISLHY